MSKTSENLILQHYTGELGELEQLSQANIAAYAAQIGVEYRRLDGDLFKTGLTAPCQKLAMLNEEFDDFDQVVMMDMDMFARLGLTESIFDVLGIGVSTWFQRRLKWKQIQRRNGLGFIRAPYWGGAIWKLTRKQRKEFRSALPLVDLKKYSGRLEDEGIMHALAYHLQLRGHIMPDGDKWAYGSYLKGVENAALIHVRPRTARKSPKVPKMDVYRSLVQRGLISS